MNYEKEYKETFERAQKIYNDIKNDDIIGFPEQITYIFPNINDSEDDSIRKEIIDIVEAYRANCVYEGTHRFDDCLAWLKKQKERDLDIVPELRPTAWGEGYQHGCKDTEKKLERVINASRRVLNNWLDGSDCPDVSGDFTELEYAFREYDGEETTICGQDYKCKKDYKKGNCWYIKDVVYHCSRNGYLTDQNGVSWSCPPSWFNEYIYTNSELSDKEKNDFVSGQFLQCKHSFDEFKEGEHYWLEYVGDDTYIGRSDNILNQKFHITPRQLFTLFSQQLDEVQGPPEEEKQVSLNYEPPFDENPSDKEIIEALIHHLNEQDGFLTAIDCVSTKAILSWLEKQKECVADSSKTSADYDERLRKAALEGIEYLEHNLGWDAIGDTDILDVKEYIEKQKEQKPTSFNEPYNPDDYEVVMEGNATSVKRKDNRMQPIYDNLDSFESALEKAWKEYNDSGSRTVDGCEDNYVECAHAKGFREGYLFGLKKQKENHEEPKIAFGDWGDKEKQEAIFTCLKYMRFIKKLTKEEFEDLTQWLNDNLVSNVLEKDGWTIANEQIDTIKEDYYGAFLRGEMRGYLRGVKQKEQIPYTDFVIKPHKGDDNNPYDMRVSDAQEYAINRGFGIPFNDGEVYIDERHMTQTIGNVLRWADEHPKEQKTTDIPLMNGDADLYFDEWNQQQHNPTKRQCFEEGIRYATKLHLKEVFGFKIGDKVRLKDGDGIPLCCDYSDASMDIGKEPEPIKEVFGFKIGDKVRLKDGDGRPHIIKSFEEIEGIHGPNFYRVTFEDNSASDHIFTGDYKDGYFTNMEKLEEQKPINYEYEMWKNCEANYNKGKEIGFKEGYDKAMNDHNHTWTYNDEQMYQNIIEVLAATLNYKPAKGTGTGLYVVGLNTEIEWLKNIINKLKKEQ